MTAMHAFNRQAVLFNGREIGAARDEENIVAGRGHARAEITADGARRHCCNPHEIPRLKSPGDIARGLLRD